MCKSWNGPAVSIDELEHIITRNPDLVEKIVKTELTYYKHTHRSEVIASPHLFRLIKVSHEERLSNFCILLNGQSTSFTNLPKNKDALIILRKDDELPATTVNKDKVEVGGICITLWREKSELVWYIGYCISVDKNGLMQVEHLHQKDKTSNLKWRYPSKTDLQTVDEDQILDCGIKGNWDVLSNRINEFTLVNHEEIHSKFMEAKDCI